MFCEEFISYTQFSSPRETTHHRDVKSDVYFTTLWVQNVRLMCTQDRFTFCIGYTIICTKNEEKDFWQNYIVACFHWKLKSNQLINTQISQLPNAYYAWKWIYFRLENQKSRRKSLDDTCLTRQKIWSQKNVELNICSR